MSLTADEIIRKLSSTVNDEMITMSYEHPPSFLNPFIKISGEKIIFIYKRKEDESTILPTKREINDTAFTEDSDLTGHPLECPFSIDGDNDQSTLLIPLRKNEMDQYLPLTIHEARQILLVNNLTDGLKIPVYILTDGTDYNNTIVLSTENQDELCVRSWITFNKHERVQLCESNLDSMIQRHHNIVQISPHYLKSEVSCVYLIENVIDNPSTILTDNPGHIELHVSWKTPSVDIPLHEASTNVVIHAEIGHESSDLLQLWKQVLLLNDLLQYTKKCKEEVLLQQPYSRHNILFPSISQYTANDGVSNSKRVSEKLQQLLTEPTKFVSDVGFMYKNENYLSNQISQLIANLINEKKTEQEFTDQLWNILIECTSYQEAYSSFELVFKHVKNGSCHPYIKSINMSRLSHALRCCKRDPSSNMELILEPVEMLIEIGIETLKKDYINIFLLTKVATLEQLCVPSLPKFTDINTADWSNACSSWILWFARMHVTLEMALLVESMLDNSTVAITGGILKHYLGEKSTLITLDDLRLLPAQDFEMVVNARDIQKHFRKGRPYNSWSLKLTSETPHRLVKSVFHRTSNEIFPSYLYTIDDKFDLINCTNNNPHTINFAHLMTAVEYCYSFHSISTKLL